MVLNILFLTELHDYTLVYSIQATSPVYWRNDGKVLTELC